MATCSVLTGCTRAEHLLALKHEKEVKEIKAVVTLNVIIPYIGLAMISQDIR